MFLTTTSVKAGLAALALVASTAAAFASPAVAVGSVNVRTGPGTQYGKVDTLFRGEQVNVQQCKGSWCYVTKSGPDGWVSSSYLASGNNWHDDDHYAPPPPSQKYPRPVPVYPRYPVYPGYGHGPNWGGGAPGFCLGGNEGYFCVNP